MFRKVAVEPKRGNPLMPNFTLCHNEFIAMLAGHGLNALNPCSDEETMA